MSDSQATFMEVRSERLDGRWAVVTGSSSGIGRAISLRLAAAGARLVVHGGHEAARARGVAEEIRRAGQVAEVVMADLAAPDQQDRFVASVLDVCGGPPHVLVNNAGADVLTGDAGNLTFEEKLETLWRVDVVATMRLARAIGAAMRSSGRGVILNLGWDQAATGMEGDSGEMFSAVKGAVAAFSRSLARSLAPHVRVNCLAPGWIRTAWGALAGDAWDRRARAESLSGRWGTPEDVAEVAAFLAGDASSFLNGQVIDINGGRP